MAATTIGGALAGVRWFGGRTTAAQAQMYLLFRLVVSNLPPISELSNRKPRRGAAAFVSDENSTVAAERVFRPLCERTDCQPTIVRDQRLAWLFDQ